MDFEAPIVRFPMGLLKRVAISRESITNFTQMSCKLASHCGRKTILFDGTARIHSQGDGLGRGGFRWSHQLDGKRRSPYHFGLLPFKQETSDRRGTGHQRSSLW